MIFAPFAFQNTIISSVPPGPVEPTPFFNIDFASGLSYPGSGSIVTELVTGITGTITNSPTYTSGQGFFTFNGTNQRMDFNHNPAFTIPQYQSNTIILWWQKSVNDDRIQIIKGPASGQPSNYPGNYELRTAFTGDDQTMGTTKNDGGLDFPVLDNGGSTSLNTWYNTIFVNTFVSGSAYSTVGYKNGVSKAIDGTFSSTAFVPNTSNVRIGARLDGSSWWNGKIAQIQFYNTALTDAQIQTYYSGSRARFGY